jgi:hypothetical protein
MRSPAGPSSERPAMAAAQVCSAAWAGPSSSRDR